MSNVGDNIQLIRLEEGHGVQSFAKRLGVKPSLINDIEKGLKEPSEEFLQLVSKEVGVPVSHIIQGQNYDSVEGFKEWLEHLELASDPNKSFILAALELAEAYQSWCDQ
ncbi:helix-turn-helix domain-containing protein [Aerococcus mictus]